MGILAKLNPITAPIGIFCDFPGAQYWFPVIYPIVNIPAIISSFIPILLSIILGSQAIPFFNSKQNDKGEWEKDSNRGALSAFIIYYVLGVVICFSVIKRVCGIVNYI